MAVEKKKKLNASSEFYNYINVNDKTKSWAYPQLQEFLKAVNLSPNFSALLSKKSNTEGNDVRCICSQQMKGLSLMAKDCKVCLKSIKNPQQIKILILCLAVAIMIIIGLIIFIRIKPNINNDSEVYSLEKITNISPVEITDAKLPNSINSSTELLILAKLNNFEENKMFTKKGVTLGNLATEFGTNVKYLSAVIKKYKSDNFKSYINNLRINYIITKMESDIAYRKYKISYLAEITGFATASSFTKTFKEITGLPPSLYFENKE
ncbi:helix-turn-helix domain-containing protein [Chryseobacterium sp. DT-3]|uniref:helix-turn-helix domain-containing protein n=1 Tax=Chryseobacterium sp. DT-3 TaxID=3396164 RepID=UPI003F1C66BA